MLGLVRGLLTLPALGAPQLVRWLAGTLDEEAHRQQTDEAGIRGELLALQQRYDAGELDDEEYDRQEQAWLERLGAARARRG